MEKMNIEKMNMLENRTLEPLKSLENGQFENVEKMKNGKLKKWNNGKPYGTIWYHMVPRPGWGETLLGRQKFFGFFDL